MALILLSKHWLNSKAKIMWTFSSMSSQSVYKKELDSLSFQRIKMEENPYHSLNNNICLMDKNTLSLKLSLIVLTSQINKVNFMLLLLILTDTLISLNKSLWMRIKSSKLLTTNTFYLFIPFKLKQVPTSLKKSCKYLFYLRNHDKDGVSKGINTVVFKK